VIPRAVGQRLAHVHHHARRMDLDAARGDRPKNRSIQPP
jgi:hypothetical protein